MSTRKTLRLKLTALVRIGVNPYNELEMLKLIKNLILPAVATDNNKRLEQFLKNARGQKEDVFYKNPLLLGTLQSIGIMNTELMLVAPISYNNNIVVHTIDIGCETVKWLWRPVIQNSSNIRIGSALIEYSLVRNILLKINNDIGFIQRQCYPMKLNVCLNNIQSMSCSSTAKKGITIDGQLNLFDEQNDISNVLYMYENISGYDVQLIA